MADAEGRRFGPFTIQGALARGGQGAVLRARDDRTGAPVALKLLLGNDEKGVRRFRQEAQVLARLAHPSIVRVVEHGVEQGAPYLAMELVDGETLGAVVARVRAATGQSPPAAWSARALASVADALEVCHASGIVHRDLKPENILIERGTGRPVLVDFGLLRRDADVFGALSIDARSRLSETGDLRGTPAFMSPEQATPTRFGAVSPRTDVYGLGAVLHFALTGEAPFSAGSIAQLIYKILEEDPPDARTSDRSVPEGLARVALAALRKRPEERPATAAAFASALRAVVGAGPPGPPPITAAPSPPSPAAAPQVRGPSDRVPAEAHAHDAREAFPYELVRQLGQGGMGTVHEVRRPGDPRRLAAKFLTKATPEARARFQREGELVARLDHPGIVPVLGSGLRDGEPYLIFELVQGRSLADLLKADRRLPEERVLDLGEQLARALGHAHGRGVVHRDVKPENLLVEDGPAGRLRVADFGIALAADQERLTRTGQVTGTAIYMAPEQLGAGGVGPWTDVHAAGAVMLEALTGRRPFEGDSTTAVVARIVMDEAPLARSLLRSASPGLEAVIARCLEKDGARRYPDGNALAVDLAALRRGESGSSVSSFLRAARRSVRRRLTAGALAALIVLLSAAGGGAWLVAERRAQEVARETLALAGELDALALQLEQSGASDKALERVARDVGQARVRLERTAEGSSPERARLVVALAALELRRDAAMALLAADALRRGPVTPQRLAAALAAFELVAPGACGPDLEEARARAAFTAGRLDLAVATLAPITREPAPPAPRSGVVRDDLAAWLEEPAARRAWLLAWAEVRLGSPGACERIARGPPVLRALLRVAAACVAPDAAAATAALEQARAELGATRGPEAALVLALARIEALRRREDAPLSEALVVLVELRRVSDPSGPARAPRDVQAAASLVEGDLLLRLGWWAAAAEAFARAGRGPSPELLLPAVPQALLCRDAGPCVLLGPDAAAQLGLARALALRLDDEAALAAAQEAAARLAHEHPPAALARARALVADATALPGGGEAPPPELGDLPRPALGVGASDVTAGQLVAEAAAELGALQGAPDVAQRGVARARRALRLALRLPGSPRGEARALLAQVELRAGDLPAARAAVDEAARLDPAGWRTREASGRLLLAEGQPARGCAELEAAVEALAALPALERGERTSRLLRGVAEGLRAARRDPEALRLMDLESRCADRDRRPVEERRQLQAALERHARWVGAAADPQLQALAERRAALDALGVALAPRIDIIGRSLRQPDEFQGSPALREALQAMLAALPYESETHVTSHVLQGRMRAEGFDTLALGFEVGPRRILEYLNDASSSPRGMDRAEAETLRASVARLFEPSELDPHLPDRPDPQLRLALAGLYSLDLSAAPRPDALEAAARGAQDLVLRRPETPAACILQGRLRLGLGDAAGALEWLERARGVAATAAASSASPYLSLYEAMAQGALRRWPEARRGLERAVEEGLRYAYRIREEPAFWEDRELSGTLEPGLAAVAAALEKR